MNTQSIDPRLSPENLIQVRTASGGSKVLGSWVGPRDSSFRGAVDGYAKSITGLNLSAGDALASPISPREQSERTAAAARAQLASAEAAAIAHAEATDRLRHIIKTSTVVKPLRDLTFAEVELDKMLLAKVSAMSVSERAATLATSIRGGEASSDAFAEALARWPSELTGLQLADRTQIDMRLFRERKPAEAAAIDTSIAQHRIAADVARELIGAASAAGVRAAEFAPKLAALAAEAGPGWPA